MTRRVFRPRAVVLVAAAHLGLGLGTLNLRGADAGPLTTVAEKSAFILSDPRLVIELVAAEPNVSSPVSVAWDALGRMFVAEMNDYPDATEGGQVRLLEDLDGDGFMERSRVFASGLSFPSSVLPWEDGILVASAPDILFLRDTDGDGTADDRRVVATGFGKGNQQLRVNSLTLGIDGWVYGANGRSDGEIRLAGGISGFALRQRDFRFRPREGLLETIAGPSQFGLGFDTAGNRFLSWNTNPVRHEVIPLADLERQPSLPRVDPLETCLEAGDDGQVFPLAPPPQTFNRESVAHFNALAGLHVYGGDALPAEYRGNAFLGETLRSLVHRRILRAEGPTFVAQRAEAEREREFIASRDPWFHPVNFTSGPDGALYICDFYRRWVEHPGFVPESLRGTIQWREGAEHGRLWRVRAAEARPVEATHPRRPGNLPTAGLVGLLSHSNAWHRQTAQRLLLERRPTDAPGLLRKAVRSGAPRHALGDPGRLAAVMTLAQLEGWTSRGWAPWLRDPLPALRAQALRAGRGGWTARDLYGLEDDPDSRVRLELALAAGGLPEAARFALLERLANRDGGSPWHRRAWLSSATGDVSGLTATLLRKAGTDPELLHALGRIQGASSIPAGPSTGWVYVVRGAEGVPAGHAWVWMAGLMEGLRGAGKSPADVLSVSSMADAKVATRWTAWLQEADRTVMDAQAAVTDRARALHVLAGVGAPTAIARIRECWKASAPPALQEAAVASGWAGDEARVSDAALADWGLLSSAMRRRLTALLSRTAAGGGRLLDAVEGGRVQAVEVGPAERDALSRQTDTALRARVARVLGPGTTGDRAALIERYRSALTVEGNRERGAVWFGKQCLTCHALGGRGGQVGPDLVGLASRPREALLVDLLDPSRQVAPDFVAYTAEVKGGDPITGRLVAEGPAGVTLRRAGVPDETVARARLLALNAEARSLMPDGFEAALTPEAVADLFAFLAAPDPSLIPAAP